MNIFPKESHIIKTSSYLYPILKNGQLLLLLRPVISSLLMLVAHANSDARVAAFLLQMSHRLAERGFSPDEFQLRMSRADIGSYLGLTLETVSRTMSALDARGWVRVHKKRLRLLRRDSLAQLCDEVLPGCDPLFACGAPPARIAA